MFRPATALLLVLAALAAAVPAAASAAETGFNATNSSATEVKSISSATGAQWVRQFVRWDLIETRGPGTIASGSLAHLDQVVADAHAAGRKVVVGVLGTPSWASGSSDPMVPPDDPASYGRFLGVLAHRYAGRVAAWEIWNEPDEAEFWHGTVGPAAYAPLLAAAHSAIKAQDPATLVLAAASTGNDYPFLEGLYAAGAGDAFDGVAVHTDTACNITSPDVYYRENGRVGRFSFLGLREIHATLAAHGDGARPIIMTEIGWSATSTTCARGVWAGQKAAGVTEAQQASFLKLAYRCLANYPYVKAALWFNLRDNGAANVELNRYGLIRWDGSNRPAFDAFRDISRNGPGTDGTCGDFSTPSLTVAAPLAGTMYDRTLPISASAVDAHSTLSRLTFYANGARIRSFTGAAAGKVAVAKMTWFGARNLPYGDVTITIEAVDAYGNARRRSVQVRRVDPATLPAQPTRLSLRVAGSGRERTVRGRLGARTASAFTPQGRVRFAWQYRSGTHWVTRHRASRNAAHSFSYRQHLARPARWRLVATYSGNAPFRSSRRVLSSITVR
ncbi:unannotated protein [freshwater metagenome]|uniref:Unannotated protein n=1 Tax=freshwater metagenome TaxID=449393 RepID=A0A6J7DQ70_9ZZZZ|nr:cellulase family glycosylhydrolase [Actinomycetota bacterium]